MKKKILLPVLVLMLMFHFIGKAQKLDYSENLKFNGNVKSHYYCGEHDGKLYYVCKIFLYKPSLKKPPLHLLVLDKETLAVVHYKIADALIDKWPVGSKLINNQIVVFYRQFYDKETKPELGALCLDLKGNIIEDKILKAEGIFRSCNIEGEYSTSVYYDKQDYFTITRLNEVWFFDTEFNAVDHFELQSNELGQCKMSGNTFLYFERSFEKKGFNLIQKLVGCGRYDIAKHSNEIHKFSASSHFKTGELLVDDNDVYVVMNKVKARDSKFYTKEIVVQKFDLSAFGLVKEFEIPLDKELIEKSYTKELQKSYNPVIGGKKLYQEMGVADMEIENVCLDKDKHLIILSEQYTRKHAGSDPSGMAQFKPIFNNSIIIKTDLNENSQQIVNRYVERSYGFAGSILSCKDNKIKAVVWVESGANSNFMTIEFDQNLEPTITYRKKKQELDAYMSLKEQDKINDNQFLIIGNKYKEFNFCKVSMW